MDSFIPSCREAVRLESKSLDEPLSLAERLKLTFHRSICSMCRKYSFQLRFMHYQVLNNEKMITTSTEKLSETAKARMIEAIRKEPKTNQ